MTSIATAALKWHDVRVTFDDDWAIVDAIQGLDKDDARDARWVPVRRATGVGVADGFRLAFDHEEILRDALQLVE